MNVEQAKAISIVKILDTLGFKITRKRQHENWYLSPFRNEKTASFHVNEKRNIWYDFGLGIGGNAIKFATVYLASQKKSHSLDDAKLWLNSFGVGEPILSTEHFVPLPANELNPTLQVKSVKELKHPALLNYLHSRGIPRNIGTQELKEIRVYNTNTQKNFFALGMPNEEGGYEIRNPFFKGCIGKKHITFIRGNTEKPDGINLFEGFMDYLTALTIQGGRKFINDTVILNSTSCVNLTLPYLKGYGYRIVYTWLHNDEAGKHATEFLNAVIQNEESMVHQPMNDMYAPYKDLNAWHMHKLEL